MKVNYLTQLAGATLVLLSAAATRAAESAGSALATDANAAPLAMATTASTAPVATASGDTATYCEDCDPVADFIARAGVWAVQSSGSPTQVGQYQNVVQSSPFWNADGIWSNGERAIDFTATGSDNDTTDGFLRYYGPHVEANLGYERFDHQLYEKSYNGWASVNTTVNGGTTPPGNAANDFMSRDNFGPGQDYAIRVQEWKANFHGNLTDNLKWRVNTFGIDKEGTRQANAVTHCYEQPTGATGSIPPPLNQIPTITTGAANQCHAVSQPQHIDWQTTEVEPGLELNMGQAQIAYSHMIRVFRQDDQQVFNIYRTGGTGFNNPLTAPNWSIGGYNIVPDSTTQMDRLKVHAELGCYTDIYAMGYAGDTADELNQTDRHYSGSDLRITNRSIDTLTVTGYGRTYAEQTNNQTTVLGGITAAHAPFSPELYPGQEQFYQQITLPQLPTPASPYFQPPINRYREAVGINGRWRPFEDDCDWVRRNFAVTGGYEYATEQYNQANYVVLGNSNPTGGGTANATTVSQPDTDKNTLFVGLDEKWTENLQTYVRYKWIGTHYPFIGVTPRSDWLESAVNTALPTLENRIELGATWTVNDTLMLNAEVYLEMASGGVPLSLSNNSWDSNSFPYVLSAWWAPTCQWSFNAGFAEMDSWINQQMWQTAMNAPFTGAGGTNPTPSPIAGVFNNLSTVVSLGTRYAWTEKFSTCANFEYVYGENESSIPVAGGGGYNLGPYSLVQSKTYRVSVGADYILGPRVTTFARYNFYDFEDLAPTLTNTAGQTNTNESGQTNMFLVGMSGKY